MRYLASDFPLREREVTWMCNARTTMRTMSPPATRSVCFKPLRGSKCWVQGDFRCEVFFDAHRKSTHTESSSPAGTPGSDSRVAALQALARRRGERNALATVSRSSSERHELDFVDALQVLENEFRSVHAAGAIKFARFIGDTDVDSDRLARQAVGAVAELLRELGKQ